VSIFPDIASQFWPTKRKFVDLEMRKNDVTPISFDVALEIVQIHLFASYLFILSIIAKAISSIFFF
jgi:hypothetical protein